MSKNIIRILIIAAALAVVAALAYAIYYFIISDPRVSAETRTRPADLSPKQGISEWREEDRTGISQETALLKSWPENGPELIRSVTDLPAGHSSVSVGNGTIYLMGIEWMNDVLVALDECGNVKWKTPVGTAWNPSNPESRCTPTVEGDRVYVSSGSGDIACINGNSGEIIWSLKASETFKGTYGEWGIAESLIVDGEKVYFSPGGPETMTIAVNKHTGELIWKTESLNDKPAYVSPVLINHADRNMLVNVSLGHIYSVDVSNGEILWTISHEKTVNHSLYHSLWPGLDLIKCVSPLYHDGKVYVTGGYQTGGVMLELSDDGKDVSIVWTDSILDVHHGGVVLIDGYIYGSNWVNNGNGDWCCIEWSTGKTMYEHHWKCKGSVISADGMLYVYDERSGFVGLVKPDPEKFDLVSSFRVTQGSGPYWSHPVINNGNLYLRHGKALMVYDIRGKDKGA